MSNWLTTLLLRKAGEMPGYVGNDESLEDFKNRSRVTDVPAPPGAASASAPTPAGWHPDPFGKHEVRFFDGVEWTANVADNGQQAEDPVPVDHEQQKSA